MKGYNCSKAVAKAAEEQRSRGEIDGQRERGGNGAWPRHFKREAWAVATQGSTPHTAAITEAVDRQRVKWAHEERVGSVLGVEAHSRGERWDLQQALRWRRACRERTTRGAK